MIASCAIPAHEPLGEQHVSLTFPRRGDNARQPHALAMIGLAVSAQRCPRLRVALSQMICATDLCAQRGALHRIDVNCTETM